MSAARSESLPSVAETCCWYVASSVTGRAPVLSTRARSLASCTVKSPVISALPPPMPSASSGSVWSMRGSDAMTLSRTMAKVCDTPLKSPSS